MPEPDAYAAVRFVPPTFRVRCGVPVTATASENVTVTLSSSPAFSVLFAIPVAEVIATPLTAGATVSTANTKGADVPVFPASSVWDIVIDLSVPWPIVLSLVFVRLKRTSPLLSTAAPPNSVVSNRKVTSAVPAFSAVPSTWLSAVGADTTLSAPPTDVIVTTGAVVSTRYVLLSLTTSWERTAPLPALSPMVPPLSDRLLASMLIPSASLSPANTE